MKRLAYMNIVWVGLVCAVFAHGRSEAWRCPLLPELPSKESVRKAFGDCGASLSDEKWKPLLSLLDQASELAKKIEDKASSRIEGATRFHNTTSRNLESADTEIAKLGEKLQDLGIETLVLGAGLVAKDGTAQSEEVKEAAQCVLEQAVRAVYSSNSTIHKAGLAAGMALETIPRIKEAIQTTAKLGQLIKEEVEFRNQDFLAEACDLLMSEYKTRCSTKRTPSALLDMQSLGKKAETRAIEPQQVERIQNRVAATRAKLERWTRKLRPIARILPRNRTIGSNFEAADFDLAVAPHLKMCVLDFVLATAHQDASQMETYIQKCGVFFCSNQSDPALFSDPKRAQDDEAFCRFVRDYNTTVNAYRTAFKKFNNTEKPKQLSTGQFCPSPEPATRRIHESLSPHSTHSR